MPLLRVPWANPVTPGSVMPLETAPHWQDGDRFYAAWIKAHEHLTPEQSEQFQTRLILLLANHIGDADILSAAIDQARADFAKTKD
jgi:Protein of unknown function (DUF2783)